MSWMLPDGTYPMACPDCNGSGICPEWGECLLCAGFGTVHVSLWDVRIRVMRGEKIEHREAS